jgi:hypothetical protein
MGWTSYPPLSAIGDTPPTDFIFAVIGDGLQPAQVKVPIDSSKGG